MPNVRIRSALLIFSIALGENLQSHAQENASPEVAALVEAENQVSAKRQGTSWQKAVPILPLAIGDQVQDGRVESSSRAIDGLKHVTSR